MPIPNGAFISEDGQLTNSSLNLALTKDGMDDVVQKRQIYSM